MSTTLEVSVETNTTSSPQAYQPSLDSIFPLEHANGLSNTHVAEVDDISNEEDGVTTENINSDHIRELISRKDESVVDWWRKPFTPTATATNEQKNTSSSPSSVEPRTDRCATDEPSSRRESSQTVYLEVLNQIEEEINSNKQNSPKLTPTDQEMVFDSSSTLPLSATSSHSKDAISSPRTDEKDKFVVTDIESSAETNFSPRRICTRRRTEESSDPSVDSRGMLIHHSMTPLMEFNLIKIGDELEFLDQSAFVTKDTWIDCPLTGERFPTVHSWCMAVGNALGKKKKFMKEIDLFQHVKIHSRTLQFLVEKFLELSTAKGEPKKRVQHPISSESASSDSLDYEPTPSLEMEKEERPKEQEKEPPREQPKEPPREQEKEQESSSGSLPALLSQSQVPVEQQPVNHGVLEVQEPSAVNEENIAPSKPNASPATPKSRGKRKLPFSPKPKRKSAPQDDYDGEKWLSKKPPKESDAVSPAKKPRRANKVPTTPTVSDGNHTASSVQIEKSPYKRKVPKETVPTEAISLDNRTVPVVSVPLVPLPQPVVTSPTSTLTQTSSEISLPVTSKRPIILGTGLKSTMLEHIGRLVNKIGGMLVDKYSNEVTHVVALADTENRTRRTMKYAYALLSGIWIVTYDWILESFAQLRWMDEEPFEVQGDTSTSALGTPRKSRLWFAAKKVGLFCGCSFYFYGEMNPSKEELSRLVEMGGGVVLEHAPRPPHRTHEIANDTVFVLCHSGLPSAMFRDLYFQCGRYPLDVNWLLDSTSHFKLLETQKYKLDPMSDYVFDTQNSLAF